MTREEEMGKVISSDQEVEKAGDPRQDYMEYYAQIYWIIIILFTQNVSWIGIIIIWSEKGLNDLNLQFYGVL